MKFFEVAKDVGTGYLAISAGTTMTGVTIGGMAGAAYGAGKALYSKKTMPTECPKFIAAEAATFPGKIIENAGYITTSAACEISNFGAAYAFLLTSTAWNAMNYAAIGGAYGSLPVSYPFFYAYERIYNEMTSKNSTTPHIKDATCEPHEDQETNSFGL